MSLAFRTYVRAICMFAAAICVVGSAKGKPATPANREAADALFASTTVALIQIEVSEQGIAALESTLREKTNRPQASCVVREGELVFTNVAVHLKGSAGSFKPLREKPGLTLHFDEVQKTQRYHGLSKISLNNSVQDPAYVTDKLCREVYEAAGVPVPRATYARVTLNGRNLGLYLLTEGWDRDFLSRYYRNTKGNFYDTGLAKDISSTLVPKFGGKADDRSHLKTLLAAAREKDLDERLKKLEKALDLDRFLTMLVLDAMMWNWDGYMLNRNNYRIYHDLDNGRTVLFPHGMDQMFLRPEGPLMPGSKAVLGKAALEVPELRRRYLARVSQLWGTIFQVEQMTNRVQELGQRVLAALRANNDKREADDYPDNLQLVQDRIVARGVSLTRQMTGAKQLLTFDGSKPLPLKGWGPVSKIGEPIASDTSLANQPMEIEGREAASKLWGTRVWLEAGIYRVEGLVKADGVPEPEPPEDPTQLRGGPGFRVWSRHKFTEGSEWGWFPYTESRNLKKRGLLPPRIETCNRLKDSDRSRISYEFELHQPLAELVVFFELRAPLGRVALEKESVTITRLEE